MTVELPEQVSDIDEKEVRMIVAARLFEQGKLSSGRAAEVAGITKREFIETVGKHGVSIFGQLTMEEVQKDLENARAASKKVLTTSHLGE
jgi:predicted HTH domain antitoxin